MKQYKATRMFADGTECKRTLAEVTAEIVSDNAHTPVEIFSAKTGRVWCGYAENIRFDLVSDYMKRCVQSIKCDEYGVTINMR